MKAFIETFGCQMNVADSEEIGRHLLRRGFSRAAKKEQADLLILNTCTVRQHAEDKALSYIGRLKNWKKNRPSRLLLVTGCAAQRLEEKLAKRFAHIDMVVGAKEMGRFPSLLDQFLKKKKIKTPPARKPAPFDWQEESEQSFAGSAANRTEGDAFVLGNEAETALVTIMRGCNYSCSYCIVPEVRGREIYRPIADILKEIRRQVKAGRRKVMLLGQTVNSYWHKEKISADQWRIIDFPELIRLVQAEPGVEEIRFMSPHPHYMSDKLIGTLAECSKVSPMIHLPVQSGSDKILKMMKRNYSRDEFLAVAGKLRRALPGLVLSTDFIVGFPGETEGDFLETLSLVDELPFAFAYCFKYSPRAGTESARLFDSVPADDKEERLAQLLEKIETARKARDNRCSAA